MKLEVFKTEKKVMLQFLTLKGFIVNLFTFLYNRVGQLGQAKRFCAEHLYVSSLERL